MKGHPSFHARYRGWCRGCNRRYTVGENVWSPGKGQGCYHVTCQPAVVVRQATEQDWIDLEQRRALKKLGAVE